jgi:hypothetical protein
MLMSITGDDFLQCKGDPGAGNPKGYGEVAQLIDEHAQQKHHADHVTGKGGEFAEFVACLRLLDLTAHRTMQKANDENDDQDADDSGKNL